MLQLRVRRADDVDKQRLLDQESLKQELQHANDRVDGLQAELQRLRAGSLIETPSGAISTANPEALSAFIQSLLSHISALETRLDALRTEKDQELQAVREGKTAALSQSATLTDQIAVIRSELASTRTMKEELEAQLRRKEEEMGKLREEDRSQREAAQQRMKEELARLREALKEAENRGTVLEERVREGKVALENRERLSETVKAANEKLKMIVGVYRQAIEQLKGCLKDRESELDELYRGMKSLRNKRQGVPSV